jgi:hypothetical protein
MANETPSCPPHHYIIETPKGAGTSPATCKKCKASRDFPDWIDTLEMLQVA